MNEKEMDVYKMFKAASVENNTEKVRDFLDRGIDINTEMDSLQGGNIAQYVLRKNNSYERIPMLNFLLDNGVDVNQKDKFGKNLLVCFIISSVPKSDAEMVLIDKGMMKHVFNKMLSQKPLLQYEREEYSPINIIDIAATCECLYLFDGSEEDMEPEDQKVWKEYRLARLFEDSTD